VHSLNAPSLCVFFLIFVLVTVLGFLAARWKRGDLTELDEWGLGGRQFGTLITWFLVGGDFYTAYTIIAVPALVYGTGAAGFFALPYTIIVYPFVFITMPRLWAVSQKHGYITPADFVRGRYGNRTLATVVALTGILATMPYIALQLVGMETVLAQMGLTGPTMLQRDLPLTIAFLILAFYTYSSGLRAPAVIAVVKDILIYVVVLALIFVLPSRLGGYGHIFQTASSFWSKSGGTASLILQPKDFSAYSSLALGSALAAFMYPHTITTMLSSGSGKVIRQNAVLLPAYTFLLGLIALLGIAGAAAGLHLSSPSFVVPELITRSFPPSFSGLCFAAIAVAALVPAAIMSIAAANLFTRNIYKEFLNPGASAQKESRMAKNTSVFVKFGALLFVFLLPHKFVINLQLLGGLWILQTLPAIVFGLWKRWFHHQALLVGWASGMTVGTMMAISLHMNSSVYTVTVFGTSVGLYAGVWGLLLNLLAAISLTWLFDLIGLARGADQTLSEDYELEEKSDYIALPSS
jgi:solute:Na+ symporter, SSS family